MGRAVTKSDEPAARTGETGATDEMGEAGESEGDDAIHGKRKASDGPTVGAGPDGVARGAGGFDPRRVKAATGPWIAPALRRVGIMGGTFDPIHYGHLTIAEEVAEALTLDGVIFVPAARPPHKLYEEVTPAEDRAAMTALAIAGNPKFRLCRIELERAGPSFTADTLQQLADEAARQRVARELYFILSADALAEFRSWHEPERVLALATLAIVPRPGSPAPDLEWVRAQLPARDAPAGVAPAARADSAAPAAAATPPAAPPATPPPTPTTPRVEIVRTVPLATSSTHIRERALAGRSIRYLVPPDVERYIREHRLYRSGNRITTA